MKYNKTNFILRCNLNYINVCNYYIKLTLLKDNDFVHW